MKRGLGIVLCLLGVLILLLGSLTSFELYAKNRQEKISANVMQFILDAQKGLTSVKLPYPEYSMIILKKSDGKIISTSNITSVFDERFYVSYTQKDREGNEVYLYVKKSNLGEYLYFFLENPLSFGILLSGLFLVLLGIFLVYTQNSFSGVSMELVKELKALRLLLATSKVIPEESIEKAKAIIDNILKKGGGKV